MTVSRPDPPSRAGTIALVGGNLALDFVNTESGRGFPSHQNHLRSAANVVEWLAHAGVLKSEDAVWLRGEIAGRPALAEDLLACAIDLRAAIHGVGAAIGRRETPPKGALASLSAQYAHIISRARLVFEDGAGRWRWSLREATVEAVLGPVALAAVRLFTEGDLSRVKECGGHACGWLFHDATKNNRRRWCEMEVCGNRAKQKRLASRRRGE